MKIGFFAFEMEGLMVLRMIQLYISRAAFLVQLLQSSAGPAFVVWDRDSAISGRVNGMGPARTGRFWSRIWERDWDQGTFSPINGTGTGTRFCPVPSTGLRPGPDYVQSHQWDQDRDQIMSSPVDETGTGPCSVPGLGPGRESRRGLQSTHC